MANTKELTIVNTRISIMLFGSFRTKKTFFAGSFPKPYFFDFDDGMVTLIGKDVEYDTYAGKTSDVVKAMNNKLDALIKDCPYETVVVDSLTYMAEKLLAQALLLNGRPQGVPTMQDWLAQMVAIKNVMDKLFLIKCKYLIVICHEVYDKDELYGNIRITPAITGKLAQQLPCRFDVIFRSEVYQDKSGSRVVLKAESTAIVSVGSRFKLNNLIVEPSYESFLACLPQITDKIDPTVPQGEKVL